MGGEPVGGGDTAPPVAAEVDFSIAKILLFIPMTFQVRYKKCCNS